MLAPTIAGILIVIQGSLALAFSLAGVATAVRFRNSLKDTLARSQGFTMEAMPVAVFENHPDAIPARPTS